MGFKSGADGVTKQGKTKGRNLGNTGPSVGIQKGGKGGKKSGGVTNESLKALGRGLAKVKANGK
jgi:hypothetical protein